VDGFLAPKGTQTASFILRRALGSIHSPLSLASMAGDVTFAQNSAPKVIYLEPKMPTVIWNSSGHTTIGWTNSTHAFRTSPCCLVKDPYFASMTVRQKETLFFSIQESRYYCILSPHTFPTLCPTQGDCSLTWTFSAAPIQ